MVDANIAAEATGDGPLVDVARKVEKGLDTAKEKLGVAKDKLGAKLEDAKGTAQKVGQKSLSEMTEDVSSYVKDHPGQAVLVALGVGALAGFLLGRR